MTNTCDHVIVNTITSNDIYLDTCFGKDPYEYSVCTILRSLYKLTEKTTQFAFLLNARNRLNNLIKELPDNFDSDHLAWFEMALEVLDTKYVFHIYSSTLQEMKDTGFPLYHPDTQDEMEFYLKKYGVVIKERMDEDTFVFHVFDRHHATKVAKVAR